MSQKIKHESFGMIRLTRQQGGGRRMFGSALQHSSTICISIDPAVFIKDSGQDRVFGMHSPYIEVLMTEVDFARFVTAAGIGEGTPCTVSRLRTEDGGMRSIPEPPPHVTTASEFVGEVSSRVDRGTTAAKNAAAQARKLREQPRVSKSDIDALISMLETAVREIDSNAPFIVEQAEEVIENMVTKAKAEIEAFTQQTATRLGMGKMAEDMFTLPAPDTTVVDP